jgi:type I restriction enzyme R subunit
MLTKELTEQLRKNRTIDWNKKESARAKMRVLVKRLLKKYKYPPEGQEQALQVVMEQCNKWADDEENYEDKKLLHVEDDSDVRNLIYNRLQIDKEVSDLALQREVLEVFGERYPGMTPNDWRHIIEYYTSMIRKAHQEAAIEIPMDYPQAAEDFRWR